MPRPTWEPTTNEQREAIAALDDAAEAARTAHDKVRAAVERARKVNVPVRVIVERTGVARATVYRRLGTSTQD